MKVAICGSIRFSPQIVDAYRRLAAMGHEPVIHEHMFLLAEGKDPLLCEISRDHAGGAVEHADIKRKYDYIRAWHALIERSDAVLICNFDKGGIKNYIGGNTLMEIGFAYVMRKKIFLYNPVPADVPYVDEIKAMADTVIDGDLSKIQ